MLEFLEIIVSISGLILCLIQFLGSSLAFIKIETSKEPWNNSVYTQFQSLRKAKITIKNNGNKTITIENISLKYGKTNIPIEYIDENAFKKPLAINSKTEAVINIETNNIISFINTEDSKEKIYWMIKTNSHPSIRKIWSGKRVNDIINHNLK